jgi:excisionase family DNA binding protein
VGLIDSLHGQLIEIIEWIDDSRDTVSFRWPDRDREIKRGAQLVVRESQVAQFVYLGQFGDTFAPGTHTLTTANIPVLTRLRGWRYGLESPFKADVYFVTTRLFTGNTWGTSNPVMVRDQDLGVARLRAFGTYDVRVINVQRFLKEVAGTDDHLGLDDFAAAMRSRIVSVFSTALATSHVPVADVATRYRELGEALLPLINPVLDEKYGLQLASFVVENVSVPPEVEQAIDKRSGMAAVGDLNNFIKYQLAQGLEKDGARTAGLGAEMAVGLSMAQQLMRQPAAAAGSPAESAPVPSPAPAPAQAPAPALDVLSPAEVATMLKVTEPDVIASLEAGDLKGKRIGSQWRVTRSAVDQFMH